MIGDGHKKYDFFRSERAVNDNAATTLLISTLPPRRTVEDHVVHDGAGTNREPCNPVVRRSHVDTDTLSMEPEKSLEEMTLSKTANCFPGFCLPATENGISCGSCSNGKLC